jgi:hypothetical protein
VYHLIITLRLHHFTHTTASVVCRFACVYAQVYHSKYGLGRLDHDCCNSRFFTFERERINLKANY